MKKQLVKAIGRRIREIRVNLGLTQWEFARKMEMANTHLSDIETGRSGPGINFFYAITKYHKVNPLYILMGQHPLFLEEEKKQEEEKQKPEPPDFGENTPRIEEMLGYFKRSPMVRFAVLNFFSTYIVEKKDLIKDDIELHEPNTGTDDKPG